MAIKQNRTIPFVCTRIHAFLSKRLSHRAKFDFGFGVRSLPFAAGLPRRRSREGVVVRIFDYGRIFVLDVLKIWNNRGKR